MLVPGKTSPGAGPTIKGMVTLRYRNVRPKSVWSLYRSARHQASFHEGWSFMLVQGNRPIWHHVPNLMAAWRVNQYVLAIMKTSHMHKSHMHKYFQFWIVHAYIMVLIEHIFVVCIPTLWVESELRRILGLFYPKDQ